VLKIHPQALALPPIRKSSANQQRTSADFVQTDVAKTKLWITIADIDEIAAVQAPQSIETARPLLKTSKVG
jgi:hypothetical protein